MHLIISLCIWCLNQRCRYRVQNKSYHLFEETVIKVLYTVHCHDQHNTWSLGHFIISMDGRPTRWRWCLHSRFFSRTQDSVLAQNLADLADAAALCMNIILLCWQVFSIYLLIQEKTSRFGFLSQSFSFQEFLISKILLCLSF